MIFHPGLITLFVGIGLMAMSFMVVIFLFEFVFSKNNTDRSHLIELKKEQQPELFKLIEEIVKEVKTDFPKHVYLSGDVNAAVFYDSGFWSMFLPIRKNLIVGIGLVNTISVEEFKAILAHEFGHFSQQSMKVGVYVSNVNHIIFNMLSDRESYGRFVQQWMSFSSYIHIFIKTAVTIIEGIKFILKKLYEIVNLNYLKLSREMEFDADAIAAKVAGSDALSRALMRISLADFCYANAVNYYFTKIEQKVSTENIYPQQKFVMNFTAAQQHIPVENGLPQISYEYLNRFNKSKLSLVEDWNSHPSTEDRVAHLQLLNLPAGNSNSNQASTIFSNIVDFEREFTRKLFLLPPYSSRPVDITIEDFIKGYTNEINSNSYDASYNGYYDFINPGLIDEAKLPVLEDWSPKYIEKLFDQQAVSLACRVNVLENDITALKQISSQELKIQWIQYDGTKYYYRRAGALIEQLEAEAKELKQKTDAHDHEIYSFFHHLAVEQNKAHEFKELYRRVLDALTAFERKNPVYMDLAKEAAFMSQSLSFDVIEANLKLIYRQERFFKKEVEDILGNPLFENILNDEIKEVFTQYLSQDWQYFNRTAYNEKAVDVFYKSLQGYQFVLAQLIFKHKKALLDYMADLAR
ncbi:MAG: M48 family metallopeptidase [Cytophaga sp.]|uniref:M48 family metallopeptidase n=1 Tax=Cytophaga sp. TaxID=29535 RepID=UPI003F7D90F2